MKKFSLALLSVLFLGCDQSVLNTAEALEIQFAYGANYCGGSNDFGVPQCVIVQAKDNVVIEEAIINRGNCNYTMYIGRLMGDNRVQAYMNKYPQRVIRKNGEFQTIQLMDKNGNLVQWELFSLLGGSLYNISHKEKELYDSLDDESKTLFYKVDFFDKELAFGQKAVLNVQCKAADILEVVLKTKQGVFEYKNEAK